MILAVAERLLHAAGFQRVQYRAGHVLLQQLGLDRGAAPPVRPGHARVRIGASLPLVVAVVQALAAFRAYRDTGQ